VRGYVGNGVGQAFGAEGAIEYAACYAFIGYEIGVPVGGGHDGADGVKAGGIGAPDLGFKFLAGGGDRCLLTWAWFAGQ
jgi:hypothetical protein